MNREQILEVLMVLSALDSLLFKSREPVPDYLAARITTLCEELKRELLK